MKIAVRIYVVTKRMIMGLIAALIAVILLIAAITLIFRSSQEPEPITDRIETYSLSHDNQDIDAAQKFKTSD